ncbi:MAG: hypothetical protein HZB26_13505 [Candidatus Hydrogenedentes bacterium]|nr:hypothetical protein [Candidatus Hydrogenedentota bacterium]
MRTGHTTHYSETDTVLVAVSPAGSAAGDISVQKRSPGGLAQFAFANRNAVRMNVPVPASGSYRVSGLEPGRYTVVAVQAPPRNEMTDPHTPVVRVVSATVDIAQETEYRCDLNLE